MSDENAIPLDDSTSEEAMELDALELVDGGDDVASGPSKIQSFGGGKVQSERKFKRGVNTTGTGATRVKTFNCKLRVDALEFMDDQINQWLEQHPEYEVKFVTTTIGVLTGKIKEEALFVNVWV